MSRTQPRPSRGASGSALRLTPPIRTTPPVVRARPAPLPTPALRILLAGVDKDDRGAVEAAVRQGLGPRAATEPWSVSVVHMAGKLSVTVDGGGLRSASVMADRASLADAVRSLVDRGGGAATLSSAAAESVPSAEVRNRHVCKRCGQGVVVVYEGRADEPKELAPVACPHCWTIGHVEVGAWAAAGRDYRAERAE